MKVSSVALLTLLLLALWTGSQGLSFRSPYGACCYQKMFVSKQIPARLIKSYQQTPSHCSRKAVRVELRRGTKLCVDPEESWFQQYQREESTRTTP
ncbi:CCL3 protein, partial [Atlantisia rogersi]|nr:CCL3 protein [Atlantisia rogersi]